MWNKAAVTYFKAQYYHLPEGNEENHKLAVMTARLQSTS
jgi:hypothetical protein